MKKTQDKAVDLQQAQREYEAKLASLMQRYPKLFRKNLRAQYMYAIEDGWFGIIENLCAEVDTVLDERERRFFHWLQIKEKIGELRVYPECRVRLRDETEVRIYTLVEKAAAEASRTCQYCGKPGRTRRAKTGWILTVCDEHAREHKCK